MKILFVGGGRRISLAKRFINQGAKIFAYELDCNSPIASVADIIPGYKWSDLNIEDHLINIILKESFDVILPLQDAAIEILSKIKNKNITESIVVSSLSGSEICHNKKKFENHFKTFNYNIEYPFPELEQDSILKPVFGFASRGIKKINGIVNDPEYICQKFINGIEISVDSYYTRKNTLIGCVPRTRLNVLGGESVKSKTLERKSIYEKIYRFTKNIGKKIGLIGPTCSQFILDGKNLYIIEINARFGGGAILSMEAGLLMEKYIIKEYCQKSKLEKINNWTENLVMTRFFNEHFYLEKI
jgi:carbamoyl-phosphate synthase large subunit